MKRRTIKWSGPHVYNSKTRKRYDSANVRSSDGRRPAYEIEWFERYKEDGAPPWTVKIDGDLQLETFKSLGDAKNRCKAHFESVSSAGLIFEVG